MTPENRRLRKAFVILVVIGFAMNAAVLWFGVRSVNQIRGDFCTFAVSVHQAARGLPQVPARVRAEDAYVRLRQQLEC